MRKIATSIIPVIAAVLALTCHTAHASWIGDLYDDGIKELSTVYKEGDNQLFLSGYAHHGRHTYSATKLATLNERAWGIGLGKTLRTPTAHRGVFMMVISDSHKDPQPMVGYSYEKPYYFANNWYVAAGVAPLIVQRQDMFNRIPFPAIFPLASMGNDKVEARFVYIPRLSKNLGNMEQASV